jgi:hypothetical protein
MMSQRASDGIVESRILSTDMKGLALDHDTNTYVCLFLSCIQELGKYYTIP